MARSKSIESLLASLTEYEATPDSRGLELRLNLAEIVIRRLRELGWTQQKLASVVSMSQSYLSGILHSNHNCTLSTAGRLFFALGVHARIEVSDGTPETSREALGQSARNRDTAEV